MSDITPIEIARARREQALMDQAAQKWLDHAVKAGRFLLEERERVGIDEWLGWVKTNLTFSPKVAEIYMRAARNEDGFRSDPAAVAGAMLTVAQLQGHLPS